MDVRRLNRYQADAHTDRLFARLPPQCRPRSAISAGSDAQGLSRSESTDTMGTDGTALCRNISLTWDNGRSVAKN